MHTHVCNIVKYQTPITQHVTYSCLENKLFGEMSSHVKMGRNMERKRQTGLIDGSMSKVEMSMMTHGCM